MFFGSILKFKFLNRNSKFQYRKFQINSFSTCILKKKFLIKENLNLDM